MIIIDGKESSLQISDFENLEEILSDIINSEELESRVVTDVFVNDEAFSELYPHQSEDIESSELEKIEIVSVPADEMAISITEELEKVTTIMENASKKIADLFRESEEGEALEMLQDLLEVIRDFMNMVNTLRNNFKIKATDTFNAQAEKTSSSLSELIDVLENEDWILLSDILEYEFAPICVDWNDIIIEFRSAIKAS